jgi:hypothetical protein
VKQNREIESPEINPFIYGQLIFDKDANNTQWKQDSLFSQWCLGKWTSMCRRMKLDHLKTDKNQLQMD